MTKTAWWPEAKALRSQGYSWEEVAEALSNGGKPVDERTLRRWAKAEQAADSLAAVSWPPSRLWPQDWDGTEVARKTSWEPRLADRIARGAGASPAHGRRWLTWYFRLWVETLESREAPEPWAALLAGLPVLAEWLQEPACTRLAEVIRQHTPWRIEQKVNDADERADVSRIPPPTEADRDARDRAINAFRAARRRFVVAARPHIAAIRRRVDSLSLEVLLNMPGGGQSGPYVALAEILDRASERNASEPQIVDEVTGWPTGYGWAVISELGSWQLFAKIFMTEPPQGGME